MSEEEVISEVTASDIGDVLGFKVVKNYQTNMNKVYSKHYDQSFNDVLVATELNIDKIPIEQIYDMNLLDYVIINKDRHVGNIEILKDIVTGNYRLA